MESTSPPPAKKMRSIRDIKDFPMIECRREFKLPRQFPSMATSVKGSGVSKSKSVQVGLGIPKSLKDSTGKEIPITNNVRKLRIRSQDGRDLGEVKVKFLSQDKLNTKTITFAKSGLNNRFKKPVMFSVLPSKDMDNSLKEVEKPVSSNKLFSSVNDEKCDVESRHNKLTHKPLILTKRLNDVGQDDGLHNKKVLLLSENGYDALHSVQPVNGEILKHIKVHKSKSVVPINTQKNGDILTRKKSILSDAEKCTLKNSTPEITTKPSMSNVDKSLKSKEHWQLAKSKFPVVKCEKLTIPKNKMNINELGQFSGKIDSSKLSSSSAVWDNVVEENDRNSKNLHSIRMDTTTDFNINHQNKPINFEVQGSLDTIVQNNHQNRIKLGNNVITPTDNKNTIVQKNFNDAQREDCTSTVATSRNVYLNTQNVPNNVNNRPVVCTNLETRNNKNVQNEDPNSESSISCTHNVMDTANNASNQEKLSQHWNIIKEALTSVKDEELRAKALQALADCGIGIAKHVPITPPEKLRTIHDSQIQTDVFGLLDLESFVLVKEDIPTLERIKQTERSTVNPVINLDVPVQSNNNQLNCIDNECLFPNLSLSPVDDIDDIDKYFDKILSKNAEANRVKQILATPHSLYKKVATQLQQDFVAMQQWDDIGMLNIHRAVIDNNLFEVQRLLLVLRASKTSIDVLTKDGMSCLELAIKSNSSRDMVRLLLEAGAKPVTSELIHESAVILASKLSSPLLLDLLKFVTDCKLLDQVDSVGFAPLHYCALYGYAEGVNALIEAGADVNLKDNRSGRTPFFHALEHNRATIAQKLLEHGAIANLPNFSGQSVLSLVDEAKNLSLKAALKQMII